ncbi:MarR family winged helix-turn-helix transcriptional regulator [Streptomyces chrestomyceticus]|uniref:MarR family winged helix-turn-helix transcriptional regulator n=1 Tax=Streptomyces chrestomyceticus TaxID=68185 RepID=UPI0019D1C398|nr:MarR family transcriptional regulator [Streptomyces chrestomyceticus]
MSKTTGAQPGSAAEPRVEPDIEELAQAADRLFYAMRRSRAATVGRPEAAGLSMSQMTVLAALADDTQGEGLPVSRLAANAEISVPTATRMLQQLESKNVVVRRRAPHDERQVLVRLTEEGAERLAAMQSALRARQYAALSRFTPEERRELTTQMHRLAGMIGEMISGTGEAGEVAGTGRAGRAAGVA